jgi:hypothetical protein
MKYKQLEDSRDARLKVARQAPPTTKPGAIGTQQSAERKKTEEMRGRLKKSGDWRDAAALLARRTK